MRIDPRTALAAAYLIVAPSVGMPAEFVYKSIAADGSVMYSSQPMPDAKEVRRIDIMTLTPEQRRAADRARRQFESDRAEALAAREAAWSHADAEVRDATEQLRTAEAALEAGREPRADEWIGNYGGRGTRMTEGFWLRLKELEDGVTQARARLDSAFAARAALE